MVVEDYKCEECGFIIKNVKADSGDLLPKRKNCPACKKKYSCHRIWGISKIEVPNHMQAVPDIPGAGYAHELMSKKAKKGTKYY